jgi:hypothetical protein
MADIAELEARLSKLEASHAELAKRIAFVDSLEGARAQHKRLDREELKFTLRALRNLLLFIGAIVILFWIF